MTGSLTYDQAIARLGETLRFGINPSLEGIRVLTQALGSPEKSYRCIQVTGTNGKTSVTRMIAAGLAALGHSVGAYTSPHLISYTERFEIDGTPVSEGELVRALGEVFAAAEGLDRQFTEFEILTAAAFVLFKARQVEWAVLEVGMGGRWDATSIVDPAVAVITGIGLDHTDRLGSTREEIAIDKSHIIKRGSTAVIGPGCDGVVEIFEQRATQMTSPFVLRVGVGPQPHITWDIVRRPRTPGGTLTVDVHVHGVQTRRARLQAPSYQAPNIATAMAAIGAALVDGVLAAGACRTLYVLAGSQLVGQARSAGFAVVEEAFADRGYHADGSLIPRGNPGDLVDDPGEAARRAVRMAVEGTVEAVDGSLVAVHVGTICVHGDTPRAVEVARAVAEALRRAGVRIEPPPSLASSPPTASATTSRSSPPKTASTPSSPSMACASRAVSPRARPTSA